MWTIFKPDIIHENTYILVKTTVYKLGEFIYEIS